MSGQKHPGNQSDRWPGWKIGVLLYPLAVGAIAVNAFFAGLLAQWIGAPTISPWSSVVVGAVLGVPLTWIAGTWFRGKIDEAESD